MCQAGTASPDPVARAVRETLCDIFQIPDQDLGLLGVGIVILGVYFPLLDGAAGAEQVQPEQS